MACLNLAGYDRGCDASIGGIKTVVMFELDDIDSTATVLESTGELTTLALVSGATPYKYEFLKDNSNYNDVIVGDGNTSVISYTPTLNMVFRKNTLELVQEVYELSRNYVVAIVLDNNGLYWTLGLERGLSVAAAAGSSSGNALTDPNNLTIVLAGGEPRPMANTDISAGSSVDSAILALFGF